MTWGLFATAYLVEPLKAHMVQAFQVRSNFGVPGALLVAGCPISWIAAASKTTSKSTWSALIALKFAPTLSGTEENPNLSKHWMFQNVTV